MNVESTVYLFLFSVNRDTIRDIHGETQTCMRRERGVS